MGCCVWIGIYPWWLDDWACICERQPVNCCACSVAEIIIIITYIVRRNYICTSVWIAVAGGICPVIAADVVSAYDVCCCGLGSVEEIDKCYVIFDKYIFRIIEYVIIYWIILRIISTIFIKCNSCLSIVFKYAVSNVIVIWISLNPHPILWIWSDCKIQHSIAISIIDSNAIQGIRKNAHVCDSIFSTIIVNIDTMQIVRYNTSIDCIVITVCHFDSGLRVGYCWNVFHSSIIYKIKIQPVVIIITCIYIFNYIVISIKRYTDKVISQNIIFEYVNGSPYFKPSLIIIISPPALAQITILHWEITARFYNEEKLCCVSIAVCDIRTLVDNQPAGCSYIDAGEPVAGAIHSQCRVGEVVEPWNCQVAVHPNRLRRVHNPELAKCGHISNNQCDICEIKVTSTGDIQQMPIGVDCHIVTWHGCTYCMSLGT